MGNCLQCKRPEFAPTIPTSKVSSASHVYKVRVEVEINESRGMMFSLSSLNRVLKVQ